MPRQARLIPPFVVVHVISRFTNAEFRLSCDECRRRALTFLGRAAARTDWVIVGFTLMSTHIHLVMISGHHPFEDFARSLNTALASWLNKRQSRRGHVFEGRPTTIICDENAAPRLIVYVHNNPPRAGVCELARESSWTSHRYILQPERAPEWLDVERALDLCGLSSTEVGRRHFDDLVNARRLDPRNDALSGRQLGEARRKARAQSGVPLESAVPIVGVEDDEVVVVHPMVVDTPQPNVPSIHWGLGLEGIAAAVADELGVELGELRGQGRRRIVTMGRRVSLVIWCTHLRRPAREMATFLGLGKSSASALLRGSGRDIGGVAERVLRRIAKNELPNSVPG